ncbi:DUF6318 family protein [Arthrobacter sp. TWP1-1]|uniref:DUF6318 family protein n=1 Tax=Arthrobacter sp. TWP1-1 TaxID=2804568 RepID=UPI003CE6B646
MDSHATTTQQRRHQDWHHGRRRYRRADRRGRGRHSILASGTVVVFAGLLALTGCTTPGGGNNPGTASPSGATVTTTAPATTAPPPTTAAAYKRATDAGPAENVPIPVLPEKAKEFSKEGLIAFAEYWYSTLGYAFETGDPAPMLAITDSGCLTCNAMKEAVVPWHAEGRWIVGGQMDVLSTESNFSPVQDGSYQIVALVRQDNVKYFRGDKTLAEDRGAKPAVADLMVAKYSSGHWTAVDVSHIQGSKQ